MRNSKYYPWVLVGLLWVVALLNYLDRQMLSTMQSSMQIDIKELSVAENFGKVMGIFLLIYGLMSPIAGVIADRINRQIGLLSEVYCLVGGNLWHGLCPNLSSDLLAACTHGR